MPSRRESIIVVVLILLGVIIVPVLLIWSADNLVALAIKSFVAALFLLLMVRSVLRTKSDPDHRDTRESRKGG
jgi:amino acid transporter